MDADTLLTAPAKRDVKTMTADLAELSDGDDTLVIVATERAGLCAFRGPARESIVGSLIVGGVTLDQNRKPTSEIRSLAIGPSDAAASGEVADVADLAHGDLVRVAFDHGFYGGFEILGVAVGSEDGERLTVGGWFVRTADGQSPFVVEARRLAAAGEHVVPAPDHAGLVATDAV